MLHVSQWQQLILAHTGEVCPGMTCQEVAMKSEDWIVCAFAEMWLSEDTVGRVALPLVLTDAVLFRAGWSCGCLAWLVFFLYECLIKMKLPSLTILCLWLLAMGKWQNFPKTNVPLISTAVILVSGPSISGASTTWLMAPSWRTAWGSTTVGTADARVFMGVPGFED